MNDTPHIFRLIATMDPKHAAHAASALDEIRLHPGLHSLDIAVQSLFAQIAEKDSPGESCNKGNAAEIHTQEIENLLIRQHTRTEETLGIFRRTIGGEILDSANRTAREHAEARRLIVATAIVIVLIGTIGVVLVLSRSDRQDSQPQHEEVMK